MDSLLEEGTQDVDEIQGHSSDEENDVKATEMRQQPLYIIPNAMNQTQNFYPMVHNPMYVPIPQNFGQTMVDQFGNRINPQSAE